MTKTASNSIEKLIAIMGKLRTPEIGCPWDLEQNYESILPYTIEEVYEVADAIERADFDDLKGELGDLLFQIVFYAQLAKEENRFEFSDVVEGICHKLINRHPHVFDENYEHNIENASDVLKRWEDQKQIEREAKLVKSNSDDIRASLLDDIPKVLPELKRAQKIQTRVAKQGFDWPDVSQVWEKLSEESDEVKQAVKENNQANIEDEIGDLLFVCVNLARHYNLDAEQALRKANQKFEKRFRKVEELANDPISNFSLEQLEDFWKTAKELTKAKIR
ncbi:MAG: nucleoside triphosphate pyrophosphohydrolase [Gammaproteobacteria bacterium]|nr:MAG: nucleoside triphosphate pyrophosphohydrolase [Gammaproteobacteria bacterium]